ncbi:MAG: S8 family serine peptidase, partial [Opitutales bacterium]
MDVGGVSEDIVTVKGRTWAWIIFLCSLTLLAWRVGLEIGLDEPKLLEDESVQTQPEIILRPLPRVKRSIEPVAPWEPSEDLLDALLDESFHIRDIVVRLPDDESVTTFIAAARERGLRVEDDLARLRLLRVRLASGRQARVLFDLLPEDSEPEPNYHVYVPDLPETENVRGIAPFGSKAVEWLDAPGDRSNWGKGVLVAILDTGVDFTHPALEGVKGTSLNLVEDETEETSYDGHGTAVASIIAGNSKV